MRNQSVLRLIGERILKILGMFVILEPIWMLLPFAGFLYGSVLRIETLNHYPRTVWLTHFVFPVLTLGWTGPIMVVTGFLIFLIGAGQIYTAKFRRSGLVTGGLYHFVRNPQYVALTLFGMGLLFAWGRAIMFIAFFLMMFLYYYLAKSEEQICARLFGQAYEDYRQRTSFIIPGDILLRPLKEKIPLYRLPSIVRLPLALIMTMAVCFGLIWLITTIKQATLQVPYLSASVPLGITTSTVGATIERQITSNLSDIISERVSNVDLVRAGRLVVLRGPYRTAAVPALAERVVLRVRQSPTLKNFLAFLEKPENDDLAVVFGVPFEKPDEPGKPGMFVSGSDAKGPRADPEGPNRVRLIIMRVTPSKGAGLNEVLADKTKRTICGARIAPIDLGKPEGEDIVAGTVIQPGKDFPGEDLWASLMDQMKQQQAIRAANMPITEAIVPGQYDTTTLVLVQAPILRTRLDSAFAREIMDRLVESPRLREQLRNAGAGGDIVAVAFPRPGENFYHEYHRKPQISVFVMLVQLAKGDEINMLFKTGNPKLLSAFIADMDLKIERSNDSINQISTVGSRRNLQERWTFFLSGVGGDSLH
jgi:protein-S-isoprenylcysteine O-methyltransferase Ste14